MLLKADSEEKSRVVAPFSDVLNCKITFTNPQEVPAHLMTYLCTHNAPSWETAQHMSSLFYFPIDFKDIQATQLFYMHSGMRKSHPSCK